MPGTTVGKALPTLLVLAALAALAAPCGHAQVGDYSPRSLALGGFNQSSYTQFSQQVNLFLHSIEDDRWVITATNNFSGASVAYSFSVLDKLTGSQSASVPVGPGGQATAFTGAIFSARSYRPHLSFIYDSYGELAGAAVAVVQGEASGKSDVWVHFLGLTSPVAPAPPVWVIDPLRQPVNVSQSNGFSGSPCVCGLSNGSIVVSWVDQSMAGAIGGVSGILPTVPGTNPSFLVASDVYARRFALASPAASQPGPGVVNQGSGPSTLNVTLSLSFESAVDAASDGGDHVYLAWVTRGSAVDNIAQIGPGSGPVGGSFGAENNDIYLGCLLSSQGPDLYLLSATNVSGSGGLDSLTFPPRCAFNRALGHVAVLWQDATPSGGIAGSTLLYATDFIGYSEYNLFLRSFNANCIPLRAINVSQSSDREYLASVTSLDAGGWAVFWNSVVDPNGPDLRARQQAFDANLVAKGNIQLQPQQNSVTAGTPPPIWVWNATSTGNQEISLLFSCGGTPDSLRSGQAGSGPNAVDNFLMRGVVLATAPTQSVLQIASFAVNDGNGLNGAQLPIYVELDITLANTATVITDILQLVITAPEGFEQQGGGPALPFVLGIGASQSFTYIFTLKNNAVFPGLHTFTAAVTGSLAAGGAVCASTQQRVLVSGTKGDVSNVNVTATINPAAVTNGHINNLLLSVTVANSSPDALSQLSFIGDLATGFVPPTLGDLAWSPALATTTIAAGTSRTFTATLTTTPNILAGSYAPGIAVELQQGTHAGTVVVTVTSPLVVTQIGGGSGGGGTGINSPAAGGGCEMSAGDSTPLMLVAFALLASLAALACWRRTRA